MSRNHSLRRRTYLKHVGAASVTALIAGCANDENEEPADDEEPVNDDEEPVDEEEWEGIDEFYFEGRIQAWTGIEPDVIAGEDNPTLVLFEGEEYDFRWVNEDGAMHNIAIYDEDEEVVDDYATEGMDEEGEEETLEGVVVTEEMVTYICEFHPTTQVGDIEVVSE